LIRFSFIAMGFSFLKKSELFSWEGVGTSKIRTSKGQNVESFFWWSELRKSKDQNIKNHFVKKNVKNQKN